ncbi:BAT1 protein, partial [Polyodon spathula]|nr:BAT1 protein [Polyodon spathula]
MLGALCYAELGTALPSSGGEYYYVNRGLGPIPAFLLLWIQVVCVLPMSSSIKALTFAEYAVQPFYSGCPAPVLVKKGIAIAVILNISCVNCLSVKGGVWVQKICTFLKMVALGIISIGGLVLLAKGRTENLENAFSGEIPNISWIGQAFYQVFLPFAFVMVEASFFLLLSPKIQEPEMEYFYALMLMLGGLIFYVPFVHFKLHFQFFDKMTCFLQLVMEVSPPTENTDIKCQ